MCAYDLVDGSAIPRFQFFKADIGFATSIFVIEIPDELNSSFR
jgi:hypothetical protein